MQIGPAGIAMIKRFEKCPLTAYQDPGGVWTIGVGHTTGVVAGMTITQAQADEMFKADIIVRERQLLATVPANISQAQFDSCLSLAFNIGLSGFADSMLLKLFRVGEPYAAALEFQRWIHQGNRVLNGLIRRRIAEANLFLDGTT